MATYAKSSLVSYVPVGPFFSEQRNFIITCFNNNPLGFWFLTPLLPARRVVDLHPPIQLFPTFPSIFHTCFSLTLGSWGSAGASASCLRVTPCTSCQFMQKLTCLKAWWLLVIRWSSDLSPLCSLPADSTNSQGSGLLSSLSIQAFLPHTGPHSGKRRWGRQEERLRPEKAGRWPRPRPAAGQLKRLWTVWKRKKNEWMNVVSFTCWSPVALNVSQTAEDRKEGRKETCPTLFHVLWITVSKFVDTHFLLFLIFYFAQLPRPLCSKSLKVPLISLRAR